MKVSDYIVELLIEQDITDVFGYPGGMVTHLMDSFSKRVDKIHAHVCYHEQAAAFAACGYAQASGKIGVAYATSGPGATNLITGIANAYFDSIPTIFITGQVNRNELKDNIGVRQRGFQETEIVEIVKSITKASYLISNAEEIKYYFEKAFYEATTGRPGPVLLDIPMDIFRSEVNIDELRGFTDKDKPIDIEESIIDVIQKKLLKAERPCFVLGNGIRKSDGINFLERMFASKGIPFVASMIAFDILGSSNNKFGFIGAYGDRTANFIVAKSDLIIAIGTRLDIRQVGAKRSDFAKDADIIRVDIDSGELEYKVHDDEIAINLNADLFIDMLSEINITKTYEGWFDICNKIRKALKSVDESNHRIAMKTLSSYLLEGCVITTDVGQNQVWVAQSFEVKRGQRYLFSGGHGAMGYSLPAAIGAYYATKRPVYCITGDGGLQMNIQELQFIVREKIPIKIIVLNNDSLGMIRHFQEMYFDGNYFQTKPEGGFCSPCFVDIASAYGVRSMGCNVDEITMKSKAMEYLCDEMSCLIEVYIDYDTYVFPKLEFGKPNQDQEPLIDRKLYNFLMAL